MSVRLCKDCAFFRGPFWFVTERGPYSHGGYNCENPEYPEYVTGHLQSAEEARFWCKGAGWTARTPAQIEDDNEQAAAVENAMASGVWSPPKRAWWKVWGN